MTTDIHISMHLFFSMYYVTLIYLKWMEKWNRENTRNYVSNHQVAILPIGKWFTKVLFAMDFLYSFHIRCIIFSVFPHMYNILSCLSVDVLCICMTYWFYQRLKIVSGNIFLRIIIFFHKFSITKDLFINIIFIYNILLK